MGLIDGQPRSASARALEDSVMYIITRDNFDILVDKNPKALLPILKVLTSRLRETLNFLKQKPAGFQKNTLKKSIQSPLLQH